MAKIQNNDKNNKVNEVNEVDNIAENDVKTETVEVEKVDTQVEVTETPEQVEAPKISTEPNVEQLMSIISTLSKELETLKQQVSQTSNTQNITPITHVNNDMTVTNQLLSALMNRKSDKEITVVHNRQCFGGLSTHIELTGVTIDFHDMGERRAISWQQFEECVSKYKGFFLREIILLDDEHRDLAEQYGVPCIKRDGKNTITTKDLNNMSKWSVEKLASYIKSLSKNDQDFVFSYWLGKCYQNEKNYCERYKIETLNSLSDKHVFDNFLVLMNGMSVQNSLNNVDTVTVN